MEKAGQMKMGYLDWVFMIFFWMNPAWTDKLIIVAHRERRRDCSFADKKYITEGWESR